MSYKVHDIQLAVTGPMAGMVFDKGRGECVCPKCGHKNLNYDLEKNVFHCFYSGCDFKGNGLGAYAFAMGIDNMKEAYKDYCERVAGDPSFDFQARQMFITAQEHEKEEAKIAPADVIDKTLRALMDNTVLSEKHKASLLARGFDDVSGFRSIEKNSKFRKSIAKKLLNSGCRLEGVPGFLKINGVWQLAAMGDGILVPYYSPSGLMVGAQIRKDKVREGEPKYVWLSSSYRPEYDWVKTVEHRTKAVSEISWCGEWSATADGKVYPKIPADGAVCLTEGAMKGQLAFQLSGMPFIAIAGVNSLKRLSSFLEEMKTYGLRKVIIAYDMDRFQNAGVYKALEKVQEVIQEAGLGYSMFKWNAEYVNFKREHKKIEVGQFMIENRNLAEFIEKKRIKEVKALGVKEVMIGFENHDDAEAGIDGFWKAQAIFKKSGINCSPVFYHLSLKGIDDYLAFKKKGIKPH